MIPLLKVFHSDYLSGWNKEELQNVLDNCDNPSDAASPNAYCSDFLTFRGKPKEEGVQFEDLDIAADLKKIQPDPVDIRGLISPEEVTGVLELPRGACTGTLIPCEWTFLDLTSIPCNINPLLILKRLLICCLTSQFPDSGMSGSGNGTSSWPEEMGCCRWTKTFDLNTD